MRVTLLDAENRQVGVLAIPVTQMASGEESVRKGTIKVENPIGVVVAFGGQTAIKLTKFLDEQGIKILGTSADGIDVAEDRQRFDALLEKFGIKSPDCFRKYNHFVGNNEKRNLAKPCASASVPCCNFLILSKIIYFIRLPPINFGKINSIYVP